MEIEIKKDSLEIFYPDENNKKKINPIIYLENHRFKKLSEINQITYIKKYENFKMAFECCRSCYGCKCKLILLQNGDGIVVGDHDNPIFHQKDFYDYRLSLTKKIIYDYLLKNPNATGENVLDYLLQLKEFVVDCFTQTEKQIKDYVSRVKSQRYGKIPRTIEDIKNMNKPTTTEGKEFEFFNFPYTSEKDGEEKLLLCYMSPFQLELFKNHSEFVCGDGSFKYAPVPFSQYYTFHVILNNEKAFPVAFVLTQERTKQVYKLIMDKFKQAGINIKTLLTDFEKACTKAATEVFEDIVCRGCWFHFINSLFKRLNKLNLKNLYTTSAEFNNYIRKFMSLAFLPEEEIMEGYLLLKKEYIDYTEKYVEDESMENEVVI